MAGGESADLAPDEATGRPRSIFNRFRRNRPAPADLQTRLLIPDEDDEAPAAVDLDELPPLEPARSPWQRQTPEAPEASTTSDVSPDAPPAPVLAPPTPSNEANFRHEVTAAVAPEAIEPAPPATPPAVTPPSEPEPVAPPPLAVAPPPVMASVAPDAAWAPPTPAPAIEPPVEVVRPIEDDTIDEPEVERSVRWAAFRPIPVPINPYMLLLSALATLVMLAYVLVEPSPRWFLIMGALAVVGGLDGTLRATWRVTFRDSETTPALFMPAIFILAVPPLIEHNVRGLGVVPAGLAAGLAFFAIVAAQVGSARPGASYYPWARTVSTAGAYAAGFAFFSLTYVYDLGVSVSALATGLVALMLAIEVLREGELDATETAGYAAAAGATVGQWRLALHYLPVDGYLAGLAVLLGFLLVTGLLQAYITRSLDRRATIDHALIALAGAALVIGARAAGLA